MLKTNNSHLSLIKIKHKVAVITGASGRIGSVFAKLLLDSGCKVICLSRSKKKYLEFKKKIITNQNNFLWYNLDLQNQESIDNTSQFIASKFKKLDLIINNASNSNRGENFRYNSKNLSDEFMGTIGGSIILTENLLPLLRKNNNSKIVNVGSLWGFKSPKQNIYGKMQIGPSIITASGKSAMINYTKFLAVREAKYNISVNCLSPGWFPRKGPIENNNYISAIKKNIPLNRIGKLSDLISPIHFLLSDGSAYYTGQNLIVDGGYSVW
jgi:NAD(P)-dependent dehydrogenase (short-subunit alcohol dehydrogenase family)